MLTRVRLAIADLVFQVWVWLDAPAVVVPSEPSAPSTSQVTMVRTLTDRERFAAIAEHALTWEEPPFVHLALATIYELGVMEATLQCGSRCVDVALDTVGKQCCCRKCVHATLDRACMQAFGRGPYSGPGPLDIGRVEFTVPAKKRAIDCCDGPPVEC